MNESTTVDATIDLDSLGQEYVMLSKIFKQLTTLNDALTVLKRRTEIRRLLNQWSQAIHIQLRTASSPSKPLELMCEWLPQFNLWDRRFFKSVLSSSLSGELEKHVGKARLASWAQKQNLIHKDSVDTFCEELKLVAHYDRLVGGAQVEFRDHKIPLHSLHAFMEGPVRGTRQSAMRCYWQWFEENGPELDETFQSLVNLRTEQAQQLGWKSVAEFMYARYDRTAYRPNDIGHFRNTLRELLAPILDDISDRQHQLLSLDTLNAWDLAVFNSQGNPLPVNTPDWLWNRAQEIFPKVSSRFASLFQGPQAEVQLAPAIHRSLESSYGIRNDTPLIQLNTHGTMDDITRLSNAMTNILAQRTAHHSTYGVQMDLDRSFILQKVMAILCLPHVEFLFPEDAEQYRWTYLLRELRTANQLLMQDHFQQLIYSKPEASAGDRNGMWSRVEALYNPKINWGDLDHPAEGGAWHALSALFTQPFSEIGEVIAIPYGFQFLRFQQENPLRAQTRFEYLCDESFSPKAAQSFLDIKSFEPLDINTISHLMADIKRHAFSMMT